MTIFSDIESQLSISGQSTEHDDAGVLTPVDFVSGAISDYADITQHLTLPADFEDLNIDLAGTDDTLSIYGDDAENTLVMISVTEGTMWGHAFKYADATDYAAGKALLVPAGGLRV